MQTVATQLTAQIEKAYRERNSICEALFSREAPRLSAVSRDMSDRFLQGGRLLAFGKGPYATDAQHVSVEFVHPVIVGKRALPALDVSAFFAPWLASMLQPEDMVMGFGPPEGDAEIETNLGQAASRGAMTFALPGVSGSYFLSASITNPFIHQEVIEILYHTLWETVHVFFEHRELGQDVGEAGFLYPFLGQEAQSTSEVLDHVAASIIQKVAEDSRLRLEFFHQNAGRITQAAVAIGERVRRGGKLILFGNGGSATDANDWAIDCVSPPSSYMPIPAVSLSHEPANITALANDVGTEVIFLRQLIAHARPADIAIGISTSGGSKNVILALEEARKRGLLTVALLGYDGGEILRRNLVDLPLIVHSDYIPRIQEVQASTYHILRDLFEITVHDH